nr:thioredoxin family protein [Anaerolineae bacterium]
LAQEFAGRAVVGKLNVDENQRVAGQYGIMSIPTLLIFKDGKVVDQIVGAQPAQVLRQPVTLSFVIWIPDHFCCAFLAQY